MAANNRLDRVGAVRRAQRIRDGVSSISDVLDTLVEVQERQDWTALGYKDFDEYCAVEFGPDQLKLTAERRGQVVGILIAGGMSKRGAAKALGVSEGTVRNDVKRQKSIPGAQNYAPGDVTAAFTQAIQDVAAHTSGAVPPASTEGETASLSSVDSPDDGVAPPSSSGGTDSPTADPLSDSSSHAGVPAVGGQTEERDEEQSGPWDVVWTSVGNDAEIDRQTFDSHQLAVAEMERSRRAGSIGEVDVEPTPTDSPTGLEAAQPREGRSETDHHDGAGVSRRGEALPVESRPAGALLEDGGAAVMTSSSSSDPDDEEDDDRPYVTPRDALMAAFGTLADYLALVDTDVVGPQLKEADMPTLFDHTEVFETFVRRLGKARFAEMTRTP